MYRTVFHIRVPHEDQNNWLKMVDNYADVLHVEEKEATKIDTIVCVPRRIIGRLLFIRDLRILKNMGKEVVWNTRKFH